MRRSARFEHNIFSVADAPVQTNTHPRKICNGLHNEFKNSKFFHCTRIDGRAADALVGLATGIAADGVVNTTEAVFLKQWLETTSRI